MGMETTTRPGRQERAPAVDGLPGWAHVVLAGLLTPALWIALSLLLAVFLVIPQLPLHYRIDAGYEEGVGSDLPFLQGFNTAERDSLGSYRWTADGAAIVVPGTGRRQLAVRLDLLPTPAEVQALAPASFELWAGDLLLGRLPTRPQGGALHLLVPAEALGSGRLVLHIRTETFTLTGDPRQLGARLSQVELMSIGQDGLIQPDWRAVWGWLLAVACGWMALWSGLWPGQKARGKREKAGQLASHADANPRLVSNPLPRELTWAPGAAWLLAGGAGLIVVAALLDLPRWAFGAQAALEACALGWVLAIGLKAGLPALAARLQIPLPAEVAGWLVIFCVISFGLRYGGRLYPSSMPGDIGFHTNRFHDAIGGLIQIVSKNRGIDFPYPPGAYLLIAPVTLLGIEARTALQLGAALVDGLSAAVVYAIAVRAARPLVALLAAGVYVFTAATLMTTWWSFDTHIYTQFLHLLTIAALSGALTAWGSGSGRERVGWGLASGVLLGMVFLGHFGFLINTALLMGLLVGGVWLAAWRGAAWAQGARWPLTLVCGGAVAFAGVFFYSAYITLFLDQLAVAREGGLSAVAERAPVSRAQLWATLWQAGLITHFGFFPVPLALIGGWRLWRKVRAGGVVAERTTLWLMGGSLAVGLCFAALPFITLATNSPRWLMFLAWAVALGTALAVEWLWRRGWAARAITLLMGAVVLANTFWIWLGPMVWRIRPPEPF